ncbi:disulfide bond formation protein B [Phaeovulum sp.]|uniref:disulfide bond formation protein B n=1 Tax=Phaeovulum sp. TaxID=2934796 RepID=UPI0039E3DD7A
MILTSLSRRGIVFLAAGGSAVLLAAGLIFQAFGYAPCDLCIVQRWPHVAAVAIGVVALLWRPADWLIWLGALAAATTGAVGVFHTGVERKWWPGPDTCTSGPIGGVSTQDLMAQILSAPLVRCDQPAFEVFGISMATMNAVASFALVAIWVWSLRRV